MKKKHIKLKQERGRVYQALKLNKEEIRYDWESGSSSGYMIG